MDWCSVYLTPQGLLKYIYLSPPLIFPTTCNRIRTKNHPVWISPGTDPIRWMGPIRNPRWEQKRTEGYVFVSNVYSAVWETIFVVLYEIDSVKSRVTNTYIHWLYMYMYAVLRSKTKDWLTKNQDVSEWSNISTFFNIHFLCGCTFYPKFVDTIF